MLKILKSICTVLNFRRRKGCVEIEAVSGTQCKVQMGERNGACVDIAPDHLLVLVHGIMARCKLHQVFVHFGMSFWNCIYIKCSSKLDMRNMYCQQWSYFLIPLLVWDIYAGRRVPWSLKNMTLLFDNELVFLCV